MSKKIKILIAEDEENLLSVLEKKLKLKDFEVIGARDGEEALKKIGQTKPDLILLDILMPKLDGFQVLESLRAKVSSPEELVPIIVISNSGQPVEINRALALGVRDYLVKAQFTPEEVLEKINKVLKEKPSVKKEKKEIKEKEDMSKNVKKTSPKTVTKGKIVVVEDDRFLRDLSQKKLTQENYEVYSAIDGLEGLKMVEERRPDLILLDIILPGIDGFEVLKRIRSNPNMDIAKIPVILLTNLGQDADIEKGQALGANDYLVKSNFTFDEILTKIEKLI